MTVTQLANVATVIRGVTFGKDDVSDEQKSGLVPILRAGNIEIELQLDSNLVWVPTKKVSPNQLMQKGDIVICMSSGSPAIVGKTAMLRKTSWPGSVGAFCAIIRPKPTSVLPEFLAFFLQSQIFRSWTRESSGANIKNIRKSELEEFPVHFPAMEEQRRIVDLLFRAEGIVRLRREAEKKAAEIIPALFMEMFGDPATNPKGWPVGTLGQYIHIPSTVRTPDLSADAHLLCMGADSIESMSGKLITMPTVRDVLPKSGKYWFEAGDVLYSKIRPYLAKATLVQSEGYCSADMYPLRCADSLRSTFLLTMLLGKAFTEYATSESVRASMPKLNRESLFKYQFPVPPVGLQDAFAESAEAIQSIQTQQAAATVKAQATFDALLADAFKTA